MDETAKIAIDIGSSSVKVVVGLPEGEDIVILGCGQAFHEGARRGVISSLEQVVDALNKAIEEAETMSGRPVERAYSALGGSFVWGMPTVARTEVLNREGRVDAADVGRVLKRCTEVKIPPDIRPMDVVPCRYSLDGQAGLVNPLGMIGRDLEANAFVLYTNTKHADITTHAINQASVEVLAMTHEGLASSVAVLSQDEQELGCLVIDIGHESSEWMVWHERTLLAAGTTPIGGRHFSSDLAKVLKTTSEGANRIKRSVSVNLEEESLAYQGVQVPDISGDESKIVSGLEAAPVLFERAQELFREIAGEICRLDLERFFGAGVVLTGGCAELSGLSSVAERVFAQETRAAGPRGFCGETEPISSPEWSVSCGLLRWASRPEQFLLNGAPKKTGLMHRIKNLLDGAFD